MPKYIVPFGPTTAVGTVNGTGANVDLSVVREIDISVDETSKEVYSGNLKTPVASHIFKKKFKATLKCNAMSTSLAQLLWGGDLTADKLTAIWKDTELGVITAGALTLTKSALDEDMASVWMRDATTGVITQLTVAATPGSPTVDEYEITGTAFTTNAGNDGNLVKIWYAYEDAAATGYIEQNVSAEYDIPSIDAVFQANGVNLFDSSKSTLYTLRFHNLQLHVPKDGVLEEGFTEFTIEADCNVDFWTGAAYTRSIAT